MLVLKLLLLPVCLLLFLPMEAQDNQVLVFHKTQGFAHESIAVGSQTIKDLGREHGFKVRETSDNAEFNENNLKDYGLVIFLNTTGDVLNKGQQKIFENYINSGGSFFGIHAAADTEYDWEWYGQLVGAYFNDHPEVQPAIIEVVAPNHHIVAHLPVSWNRTDEWYNYKMVNPDIKMLLNLREDSYSGGNMGDVHPIAWYRELESGGVSIYTGGGHTIASYKEPIFVEHLLQCILFALKGGDFEK